MFAALLSKKLVHGPNTLRYRRSVPDMVAKRLFAYLIQSGFFSLENGVFVELVRAGDQPVLRVPVKLGMQEDLDAIENAKRLSAQLSAQVFNHRVVDVHLCDERMQTLRVVVAAERHFENAVLESPRVFRHSRDVLFVAPEIAEFGQATLDFLVKKQVFNGENGLCIKLTKRGQRFVLGAVVAEGTENDDDFRRSVEKFIDRLSVNVFSWWPVDFELYRGDEVVKVMESGIDESPTWRTTGAESSELLTTHLVDIVGKHFEGARPGQIVDWIATQTGIEREKVIHELRQFFAGILEE